MLVKCQFNFSQNFGAIFSLLQSHALNQLPLTGSILVRCFKIKTLSSVARDAKCIETFCNICYVVCRGSDIHSAGAKHAWKYKNDEKVLTSRKVIIPCWIQIEMLTHRKVGDRHIHTQRERKGECQRKRKNFLNLALSDEHAVHRDDSWDTISYFCHSVRLNLSFNVCFSFVLIFWLSFGYGWTCVRVSGCSKEFAGINIAHSLEVVYLLFRFVRIRCD